MRGADLNISAVGAVLMLRAPEAELFIIFVGLNT